MGKKKARNKKRTQGKQAPKKERKKSIQEENDQFRIYLTPRGLRESQLQTGQVRILTPQTA